MKVSKENRKSSEKNKVEKGGKWEENRKVKKRTMRGIKGHEKDKKKMKNGEGKSKQRKEEMQRKIK